MKRKVLSIVLAIAMLVSLCSLNVSAQNVATAAACNHSSELYDVYTVRSYANGYCWIDRTYAQYCCEYCGIYLQTTLVDEVYQEHDIDLIEISCNGDDTDTYTYFCDICHSYFYDEEQTPCIH